MIVDTFTTETQGQYKDSPLWKPWMTERRLRQIESLADLEDFLASGSSFQRISLDFETCDLSQRPESVCGFCLAWTAQEGVYIPIQHGNFPRENLDPDATWDLILDAIRDRQVVVYNWKFEGNILRRRGFHKPCDLKNLQDAYIYRWLFDSDKDQIGLKDAAFDLIGQEMLLIHDVPGISIGKKKSAINFSLSSPADATLYAAADPVFTLAVLDHCKAKVDKEQPITVKLEHALYKTLFRMEDNPVTIDRAYLQQAERDLDAWIAKLRAKIYHEVGEEFNIDSTKELREVLTKMGVKLPKTESEKNLSTSKDALEPLVKDYPICVDILLLRSLVGEKSRYIAPLLRNTSEDSPTAIFKFKSPGAPTGRFASGGVDEGDPVYMPMNVQAIESASGYKDALVREVNINVG